MTLMKSNTTRRSHPITRSRLRNPTSKSMTTVRLPRSARPAAIAAADVVLPTPPLPDVSTMSLAKETSPFLPPAGHKDAPPDVSVNLTRSSTDLPRERYARRHPAVPAAVDH